jgi:hypothetical protein
MSRLNPIRVLLRQHFLLTKTGTHDNGLVNRSSIAEETRGAPYKSPAGPLRCQKLL